VTVKSISNYSQQLARKGDANSHFLTTNYEGALKWQVGGLVFVESLSRVSMFDLGRRFDISEIEIAVSHSSDNILIVEPIAFELFEIKSRFFKLQSLQKSLVLYFDKLLLFLA